MTDIIDIKTGVKQTGQANARAVADLHRRRAEARRRARDRGKPPIVSMSMSLFCSWCRKMTREVNWRNSTRPPWQPRIDAITTDMKFVITGA